ncbi:MAG: hypothetical protein RLZZ111_2264 [Planctomycetota bacterium]|jgi:hypothetical protein
MPNEPPFDPCRQWLGIDAVDLGNARRVLGVGAGETDTIAVVRASDARLNLLRSLSPGPFEMARTALVKRVEEARDKLLAELAASPSPSPPRSVSGFAMPAPPAQWSAPPPPPPPPGVPAPPPPVPGHVAAPPAFAQASGFPEQIRIRTTVYRKRTPWVGITLAVLGLAAAAGGLGYYTFVVRPQGRRGPGAGALAKTDRGREAAPRRSEPRDASDEVPLRKQSVPREEPNPPPPSGRRMKRAVEPAAEPAAVGAPPIAEERPAPKPAPVGDMAGDMADDLQDEATDARLAEMLAALRRDAPVDETNPLLEAAFKGAPSALGRRRVEAWQQLAAYYRGFLGFRDKALAAVSPGDEFDVKSQRIIVNEVDDEVVKIRAAGQNKAYPRDKIPAGIVLAIVTRYLENGANPANDLYVGAYHLAKPASDAALAREHWERAQAGGADATALMRLLDDPVFARGTEPE